MGGAAVHWETLLHHVGLHAFFAFAIRLGLRKGGRLMKTLCDKASSRLKNLTHISLEMIVLVAATAATI